MLNSKFWKKYFKYYDILNEVIPYQELINDIIQELGLKEGNLVLDAGAGTGNITIKIKNLGAKVIALDNIKEALDRIKLKTNSIEVIRHDLASPLPFDNDYFDQIVSNNVIYTVPPGKRELVFKEFHRVLKPGGKIVVSNVREGWHPLNIYLTHLKKDLAKVGLIKLSIKFLKMLFPTIMMFYYNSKIKREEGAGNFMRMGEQRELLLKSNFINLSEDKSVYANQGVLTSAVKPMVRSALHE